MSQLLVGAGGWAYFQVPGTDSLEVYSQAFDLVELNSSYYDLPSISSASEWRKRVRDKFRFSVRCPRILVDHYGLNLLPGARLLIERLEEDCEEGFSPEIREEYPCLSRGTDVPGRGTSQIIYRERILPQDKKWRRDRVDPRGVERCPISNHKITSLEGSWMESLPRY